MMPSTSIRLSRVTVMVVKWSPVPIRTHRPALFMVSKLELCVAERAVQIRVLAGRSAFDPGGVV